MRIVLILENITNKIVVFVKFRQIIVSATMDANESYLIWIQFLQGFAVPDRDQPVLCAMNNIGVTINMTDPFIRA